MVVITSIPVFPIAFTRTLYPYTIQTPFDLETEKTYCLCSPFIDAMNSNAFYPSTNWIPLIQHQDFYLLSWSLFFCDFILFFLLETKWDLKWIANLIRSTMNMVHPVLRLLHPFDCAYLSMGWNVGRWHHWSWWTEWTQFHVDCISSTYLTVCSVMWLNVIWSDVIQ